MLIGIIADSHDNLPLMKKAVELFNEREVGFVIHAGDFVAPFSLNPLEQLRCPWIGVFGNNDGEQRGLTTKSKGRIQPEPYELNLDGKKVVVVHDISRYEVDEFARQGCMLIIHGHTHEPEVRKTDGGVLVVNPGELGGWLKGRSTVAVVDMNRLEAEIVDIS
ncbi:MAG: metallophosphoesterase [Deltaproteobacteria bacterium]|nr:MAG: metallophosphoesterase [Deltaproteobacteria bacterium]